MIALHDERVELDGFSIRLRTCGAGPDALVLFPALMDSAVSFGRLQLALRRRLGSSVASVAVDPPGYGGSEPVPGFERWPGFCAALTALLRRRFPGRLIFAGNSSGAVAATEAALATSRTAGLALLCWCDWRKTPARSAELLCPTDARQLQQLHALSWFAPPVLSQASIDAALSAAPLYRAHAASLDAEAYRAALARYRGPLLVVSGAHDGLVPTDDARATVDAHPGAELRELAHCGHYPHREQPAALADALSRFIYATKENGHAEHADRRTGTAIHRR